MRSGKRMRITTFIYCIIISLNLCAQPGQYKPVDTANRVQVDTIHAVVVTGQFRAQPIDQSIYEIKVIDDRQIRLKAAQNLGELLRTEPGFQMRSGGILGDFMRIRGMTGEHIKILVDGIPVVGRLWDRLDLGQLPLLSIDHIEIIEGPMSVVYGSNALAGAINIITDSKAEDPFKASASGYSEPGYTWNFDLFASTHIRNSAFRLHGARNFFSGWGPNEDSRFKTWKPKLQYATGGSYRYSTAKLNITFHTDYLHEELRDEGALTLENLYEKAIDAYHFTNRWNNRISVNREFSSFMLNFQAGYSYYQKRKISYLNDLVLLEKTISDNDELHDTTTFHMISARAFISGKPTDKIEYQTGFDMNDELAKGKRTGGTRQMFDGAGFMNVIYRPLPIISIQPGLRVMVNSDFKTPLIYALSVKAEPGPFTIRASYARGFRAPSLKQLYLKFIDTNHEIYGNEDLKPETAHNLSFLLNYNQVSDRIAYGAKAGFFYNRIENAIQLAISTERSGFGKYFNLEGIRYITKGGDIAAHFQWSNRLMINTGLTGTGRLHLDKTEKYAWSVDYTASASWLIKKSKIQTALFYKYSDEILEFTGNYDSDGTLNGIAQQYIGGYHTLDFTLNRAFFDKQLTLCTGLKNIFNVKEINASGSLDPHGSSGESLSLGYGRIFFIQLKYTFIKKA